MANLEATPVLARTRTLSAPQSRRAETRSPKRSVTCAFSLSPRPPSVGKPRLQIDPLLLYQGGVLTLCRLTRRSRTNLQPLPSSRPEETFHTAMLDTSSVPVKATIAAAVEEEGEPPEPEVFKSTFRRVFENIRTKMLPTQTSSYRILLHTLRH